VLGEKANERAPFLFSMLHSPCPQKIKPLTRQRKMPLNSITFIESYCERKKRSKNGIFLSFLYVFSSLSFFAGAAAAAATTTAVAFSLSLTLFGVWNNRPCEKKIVL
jgi:hypothetical protein